MQLIEHKQVSVRVLSHGLSVGLFVCVFVCPVDYVKTVDCIWMPFGMVGWLGSRMRQVDRDGDHPMGRGSFEGECWASHPIVAIGGLCGIVV